MGNYKKGLQLSEDPISSFFFSSKNYPTVAEFQAFELDKSLIRLGLSASKFKYIHTIVYHLH